MRTRLSLSLVGIGYRLTTAIMTLDMSSNMAPKRKTLDAANCFIGIVSVLGDISCLYIRKNIYYSVILISALLS
jgi:hypothetical protein